MAKPFMKYLPLLNLSSSQALKHFLAKFCSYRQRSICTWWFDKGSSKMKARHRFVHDVREFPHGPRPIADPAAPK